MVNTSNSSLPYASIKFLTFFIPHFFKTVNESFQIMWMHIEKGLLYQIEEKKSSLILEKKNSFERNQNPETNLLNNHILEKNNLNLILQSFFGLAHATILFPYSQGYIPFILRNKTKEVRFSFFVLKTYKFHLASKYRKI